MVSFLPDSAEGTIGDTGAALDALGGVDDKGLADLTGDGVHRAVAGALGAALALFGIDGEALQPRAGAGGAALVPDMGLVLGAEILDGAHHGVGGRLAQAAQGGIGDGIGQLFQQLDVALLALSGHDALQDLQHPAIFHGSELIH